MRHRRRKSRISESLLALANWVAPQKTGEYLARVFLTPRRYERPPWEKNLVAKGNQFSLPSGRKIWKWGESGEKVILVHGWEGRGTQLGAFVDPLLSAGYQVYAWDGPSHGDSPGESTHLLEFSQALHEDLNFLKDVKTVIAHSMGAAALILSTEQGLEIKKAILIASPTQWAGAVYSLATRMNLRSATVQAVIRSLEEKVGKSLDSFDLRHLEKKGKFSLFLIHDDKDDAVPLSEFEKLKSVFPEAKEKLYSGLGHRKILKDKEVIGDVLQFIKEAA